MPKYRMQRLVYLSAMIISLSSPSTFAGIPKEQCTNLDYSGRFGPVRDQDGHGYCWAFSAAALVEEALCKKDKANCGKSVSPLDISRCDWSLLKESEGRYPWAGLKCAVYHGVCFEELAPYSSLASLGCTLWDFVGQSHASVNCNNQKVAKLFKQWKEISSGQCGPSSSSGIEQALSKSREALVTSLKSWIPEQVLMGKAIMSLFADSFSSSDFLRRVLISQECESNRNLIKSSIKRLSIPQDGTDRQRQELMEFIIKGLKSNASVGITLNLGRTGLFNRILYGKNSLHAVVVSGMRYNEQKKRCEFQLRNSWGEWAAFHGWYPVEDLQSAIYVGTYLDEK